MHDIVAGWLLCLSSMFASGGCGCFMFAFAVCGLGISLLFGLLDLFVLFVDMGCVA